MQNRRAFLATSAAAALCAGSRAQPPGGDAAFDALLASLAGLPDRGAAQARLDRLDAFDPATLSPEARLDYRGIREGLALDAELAQRFPYGTPGPPASPYLVSPRSGLWLTASDAKAHPDAIDAETAQLDADAACGVVPPDFILDATLAKLAASRAAAPPAIVAALDRQIAALGALRPKASHQAGAWRLPDGDAYYALALKAGTSLDIDPETAHRSALDQIAELSARADALLKQQGLAAGSVGARLHALGQDARYLYSDDDAGRARAVAEMNARLARVRTRLGEAFTGLSQGAISVQIAGPGKIGYRVAPTYDGSKPGAYYVDLRDIGRRPSWSLPTVVHHETLPGHLLQLPLEERAHPRPLRLRTTPNAFFEGWAIYAEQLGVEMGLFAGEPLAEIGFLQSVLVRAARLAIDTGIHFKRWTREQAIARFFDIAGDAPDTLANEVDRIVVQPGLTAGPALGRVTILGLREAARARPGFTLAAFHDAVLKRGQMRLSLLKDAMNLPSP